MNYDILSYPTWIKKYNPVKKQINDFIGSRIVREPTLISAGLKNIRKCVDRSDYYKSNNLNDWLTPKKIVKQILSDINYDWLKDVTYFVYDVWKARDGHTEYIDIYYKTENANSC